MSLRGVALEKITEAIKEMLIGMIEKIYDSVVNYRQGKKEAA